MRQIPWKSSLNCFMLSMANILWRQCSSSILYLSVLRNLIDKKTTNSEFVIHVWLALCLLHWSQRLVTKVSRAPLLTNHCAAPNNGKYTPPKSKFSDFYTQHFWSFWADLDTSNHCRSFSYILLEVYTVKQPRRFYSKIWLLKCWVCF